MSGPSQTGSPSLALTRPHSRGTRPRAAPARSATKQSRLELHYSVITGDTSSPNSVVTDDTSSPNSAVPSVCGSDWVEIEGGLSCELPDGTLVTVDLDGNIIPASFDADVSVGEIKVIGNANAMANFVPGTGDSIGGLASGTSAHRRSYVAYWLNRCSSRRSCSRRWRSPRFAPSLVRWSSGLSPPMGGGPIKP